MLRRLERALVVEDDTALSAALSRILGASGDIAVSEASTTLEAMALLEQGPPPDLVIIDVRLPDGSAFGVLDMVAQLSPVPVIVAMSGKASPDEAFQLAQRGVRKFLQKPFSIEEFTQAIEAARNQTTEIEPMISAWVGRVPMLELQREVRRVMVKEALALTEGSRSGAARLLHVTRQAIQQIVRSGGANDPATRPALRPPPPKDPAS
jgi:two-component system response regulator RegA